MYERFATPFNALVIGASRGIGFALVQALLGAAAVGRVYAACRTPNHADALVRLHLQQPQRSTILAADVTQEGTLETAADTLRRAGDALHLLINCAGTLHDDDGLAPERRLAEVQSQNLARSFAVNASGALLVAKHFVPLLTAHGHHAVLATLSARVGSIGDNRLGGWYAYRAAKAAQNQITRTLAVEMVRRAPQLVVAALHPGTVDTRLSQPFQSGVAPDKLFAPECAARQLLQVIDGLVPPSSGRFFAWDGQEIPW